MDRPLASRTHNTHRVTDTRDIQLLAPFAFSSFFFLHHQPLLRRRCSQPYHRTPCAVVHDGPPPATQQSKQSVVEGLGPREGGARGELRHVEALEVGIPEHDVFWVRGGNDRALVVRVEGRVEEGLVALFHPGPNGRRLVCELVALDEAVGEEGAEATRVEVVQEGEQEVLIDSFIVCLFVCQVHSRIPFGQKDRGGWSNDKSVNRARTVKREPYIHTSSYA